jgi:hypothetical protein
MQLRSGYKEHLVHKASRASKAHRDLKAKQQKQTASWSSMVTT